MKRNKNFLQKLLGKNFKDSDADGLSDEFEKQIGTNPYKKDTDDDGVNDLEEVFVYETDPNNPDTDKDGVSDGDEIKRGSNPNGFGNLKNFFIPNKNNNYKPKSLDPKRLFFYSISVIAVKAILLLLVFSYPITAWMTPDISREESRKIVALTNNLRSSLSLDALVVNEKLNQAATKKVQDMLINQYFAHLSPQGYDLEYFLKQVSYTNYSVAGENLAIGFSDASKVMKAWENSPTHYNNLVDANFKEIGVALNGGKYLDRDTIFAAQYFALPKENSVQEVSVDNDVAVVEGSNKEEQKDITEEIIIEEAINTENKISDTEEDVSIDNESNQEEVASTNNKEVKGEKKESFNEKIEIEEVNEKEINNKEDGDDIEKDIIEEEIINTENKISDTKESVVIDDEGNQQGFTTTDNEEVNEEDEKELSITTIDEAKITISKPFNNTNDKIVKVEASLPSYTESANLQLYNNAITLKPDLDNYSKENDYNNWVGQLLVQDSGNSITPPIITLKTFSGETEMLEVSNNKIIPQKASVASHYWLYKNHPNTSLGQIFNLSSIYFKILLTLAIIALLLNIFIKIKKQSLKVILSSLVFIIFLVFIIII